MSRKYNSLFDIRRSGDAINKITVERDALKAELASFKAYDNELEDILVDAAEEKVTYYGRSDSAERCKCNWCGQ